VACVDPTPTRAGRLADASVDPTPKLIGPKLLRSDETEADCAEVASVDPTDARKLS
jgi:hypothetical protein